MDLVLNEDQELIAKTATDLVAERSPISRIRELRDTSDPVGFSRELWKEMADLGWVGIPFAEAYGGSGLGLAELAVVMEALGRNLAPEPFLSTVLLSGGAIAIAGDEAQRSRWIPRIVAGDAIVALAQQERSSRYDLHAVTTRADREGAGWRLQGEKVQVLDGHVADAFVVVARCAGEDRDRDGIGLFLVPGDAPGIRIERQSRVDGRNTALIRLDGVGVPEAASLGEAGAAHGALETTVDRATVGLCAEMLGAANRAFEMTLQHLRDREQFGAPVGSFQALKHRAADVFIALELCRSTVMGAAQAVDAGSDDAPKLVSLAKAHCSEAFLLTANEGVQMFGGVGMTDEYDIGFYLKRARAAELSFGDAAFHRDRWARLAGY